MAGPRCDPDRITRCPQAVAQAARDPVFQYRMGLPSNKSKDQRKWLVFSATPTGLAAAHRRSHRPLVILSFGIVWDCLPIKGKTSVSGWPRCDSDRITRFPQAGAQAARDPVFRYRVGLPSNKRKDQRKWLVLVVTPTGLARFPQAGAQAARDPVFRYCVGLPSNKTEDQRKWLAFLVTPTGFKPVTFRTGI